MIFDSFLGEPELVEVLSFDAYLALATNYLT